MDIKDVELLPLLPLFMRRDETTRAMVKAIQPSLRDLGAQAGNALILPRLDELDSDIIDELAWDRHVDFYDPMLPLETKRELVRLSNEFHWQKGTPYAVQTMVDTLYENATLWEWFEYGGDPYMFRLLIEGGMKDPRVYEFMLYAVDRVKNKRSWLEGVTFHIKHDLHLGVGAQTKKSRHRTFGPAPYVANVRRDLTVNVGALTGRHKYRKYTPAVLEE